MIAAISKSAGPRVTGQSSGKSRHLFLVEQRIDSPARSTAATATPSKLGMRFVSDVDGLITGLRFYKSSRQHRHAPRASVDARRNAAGHRHLHRRNRLGMAAGELCHAGRTLRPARPTSRPTTLPNGHFSVDLHLLHDRRRQQRSAARTWRKVPAATNGLFIYGKSAFPTQSYSGSNYWVDVVLSTNVVPDHYAAGRSVPSARRWHDDRHDRFGDRDRVQRAAQPGDGQRPTRSNC